MKTYLLLALLFMAAFTAQAQKIINQTHCRLTVRPVCYDKTTCTGVVCGPAVLVPAGATVALPTCPCDAPRRVGYIVCYDPSTSCSTICTNIGNPAAPCPAYPVPAVLGPCPSCGNVPLHLSYTPGNDLLIQ